MGPKLGKIYPDAGFGLNFFARPQIWRTGRLEPIFLAFICLGDHINIIKTTCGKMAAIVSDVSVRLSVVTCKYGPKKKSTYVL